MSSKSLIVKGRVAVTTKDIEQTLQWTQRLGSQSVHDMHGTYEVQAQEVDDEDEA